MAVPEIEKELIKYVAVLNEAQKRSLLELVKSFLKGQPEGSPATLEQYNRELEEAMQQVERGEYTTFEDLKKEMKSW